MDNNFEFTGQEIITTTAPKTAEGWHWNMNVTEKTLAPHALAAY